MEKIIENLQTLIDSVHFTEKECNASYVISEPDMKLLYESLNEALKIKAEKEIKD